jgi:hypothetical protein
VKFFPHDPSELEKTLVYLERQNAIDFQTWEVRYILLLWLSIIVLMPFDLKVVDPLSTDPQKCSLSHEPLIKRLQSISKRYLNDSGKPRDAAAELLSVLLTRYKFIYSLLSLSFMSLC